MAQLYSLLNYIHCLSMLSIKFLKKYKKKFCATMPYIDFVGVWGVFFWIVEIFRAKPA